MFTRRIHIILTLLFFCYAILHAQSVYHTRPVCETIKSLQVIANGDSFAPPIITMSGDESIIVKFDNLVIDEPRIRYRVVHCNADWTPSALSEVEYLRGFNDNVVDDYRFSENTSVPYIHYQLAFPNNDVQLLLSGNYTVEVYEDNRPENVLLTACFSVVEPQVHIEASVSGITDIDMHARHQQVSFNLNTTQLSLRDPMNELTVAVMQNNRRDTRRNAVKPTFINPNRLVYSHNRDLIFAAGNEYRRFEIVNNHYNGMGVFEKHFENPYFRATLFTDALRANKSWTYDEDQNGRFFIRNSDAYDSDVEADYYMVNFSLDAPQPFLEPLYLNGDFTYNNFSDENKMRYDSANGKYYQSVLMKQGAYNYQYLCRKGDALSTSCTEGDYYETHNEYLITVYYRQPGARYDKLVGYAVIE